MRTPARPFRVSVRTRLVAVITLVAALALAGVGAVVYTVERARILAGIDELVHDSLASARHIIAEGTSATGTWAGADEALTAVVQRMSADDNTGALGIIDGRAVIAPGVPLDVDLRSAPSFVRHVAAETTSDPVIGTFAEEGVVWRYLAAPIAVTGGEAAEQVVYTMAYDVEAELAEINEPARAYLVAASGALLVIAAVATAVATRLLRPLRRMRETAERITERSLSERLPVVGRDDVSELATTMNDMLDRLDEALDSQRRLLNDVGHELRTPITIVRGHLEVMDAVDPADVAETRAIAVDELDRMGDLVEDLRRAASLHGRSPITTSPVDAGDLVRQIARKAAAIAGAEVTTTDVADAVAVVDAARITQAVLQLAQNAVTHAGGRIRIGSTVRGRDLEIHVSDSGPGVAEQDRERIFERFHRGPGGGSGLGLHIVHVIARAHGGSARVDDADGGGARFTIRLPDVVTETVTTGSFTPGSPAARTMATDAATTPPVAPQVPVPPVPPVPPLRPAPTEEE